MYTYVYIYIYIGYIHVHIQSQDAKKNMSNHVKPPQFCWEKNRCPIQKTIYIHDGLNNIYE